MMTRTPAPPDSAGLRVIVKGWCLVCDQIVNVENGITGTHEPPDEPEYGLPCLGSGLMPAVELPTHARPLSAMDARRTPATLWCEDLLGEPRL